MMDRQVQKYPYKKHLYLQWYEAAIANLILFKYLREKMSSHIYFLISDQGISLKATSSAYLRTAEDQIDRFFHAKIQQMDISASSDFYQKILGDIKEQTQKLKDTRDCPYINLVYSQKMKNSCLALKKFGYLKPFQNWEIIQREKKGFCYLIVRPEHRWKEMANNVMNLIKKRQSSTQKPLLISNWTLEVSYENFIWLYLYGPFEKLKQSLTILQKKGESSIMVSFKEQSDKFMNYDQLAKTLEHRYCDQKMKISEKDKGEIVRLSPLEIQKVTELIYHECGLPNLVRVVRSKGNKFLVIGPSEELATTLVPQMKLTLPEKPRFHLRQDIAKIKNQETIAIMLKLGRRHDLVTYNGLNFVMVRFQLPMRHNSQTFLKHRLPSLPRYFYYIEKNKELYLLRRFEENKFRVALENQTLTKQIFLMNSLIIIVGELHRRGVVIGNNLSDNLFVDGVRVIIEPAQAGSSLEDKSKLVLFVREWVKGLIACDLKNQLQKLNDPTQMLPIFDTFLSENYI